MTQYRLVFEETDVARIKPADDDAAAPLAWFRVMYADVSNDVRAVHVYGHAEAISDRPWLATRLSFAEAVAYCDQLPDGPREGVYDWTNGSTEISSAG